MNPGMGSHTFSTTSTIYNVAQQIVNFNHVHAEDLYIFQEGASEFGDVRPHIRIKRILRNIQNNWRRFFANPFTYFEAMKAAQTALQNIEEEGEKNFEVLLAQAKSCHQTALVDKLTNEKKRITREGMILAAGIKTYISEKDIVLANKNAPRAIRLDYVKNFVRFIPVELQNIIQYTYDEGLFDNYVILHYDPKKTGVEMTEKEKKKAADPILFGIFEGSRRLYYLGDWIDEFCDLTMDKLLDMINLKYSDRQISEHVFTEGESPEEKDVKETEKATT